MPRDPDIPARRTDSSKVLIPADAPVEAVSEAPVEAAPETPAPIEAPPEKPVPDEPPSAAVMDPPPAAVVDPPPAAPPVAEPETPAAAPPEARPRPAPEAVPAEATPVAEAPADAVDATPDAPAALPEPDAPPPDAAELTPAEIRMAVEGVLFVSPKPVSMARLLDALPGTDEDYLRGLLLGLADRLKRERRGFDLVEIAGGWQFLTRPDVHPWVRRFEKRQLPEKLTRSALETLAVVAYKQPVTRGAIEDVRGVQCGPVLRQLMDLKLVQVTGRDEHALGRPLLYGTTEAFLSRFGLARVEDLPKSHEFGAA